MTTPGTRPAPASKQPPAYGTMTRPPVTFKATPVQTGQFTGKGLGQYNQKRGDESSSSFLHKK